MLSLLQAAIPRVQATWLTRVESATTGLAGVRRRALMRAGVMSEPTGARAHRLFLDAEFTSLDDPEMLSIALVSEDGLECYVELADATSSRRCTPFVRSRVLTQFGRFPEARVPTLRDLVNALIAFLEAIPGTLEVCYDFRTDRFLLVQALESASSTAGLLARVKWLNIDQETSVPEAQIAIQASLTESECVLGIRRHHALADARALKAGFSAYAQRPGDRSGIRHG
jgi:hypothetical protein